MRYVDLGCDSSIVAEVREGVAKDHEVFPVSASRGEYPIRQIAFGMSQAVGLRRYVLEASHDRQTIGHVAGGFGKKRDPVRMYWCARLWDEWSFEAAIMRSELLTADLFGGGDAIGQCIETFERRRWRKRGWLVSARGADFGVVRPHQPPFAEAFIGTRPTWWIDRTDDKPSIPLKLGRDASFIDLLRPFAWLLSFGYYRRRTNDDCVIPMGSPDLDERDTHLHFALSVHFRMVEAHDFEDSGG